MTTLTGISDTSFGSRPNVIGGRFSAAFAATRNGSRRARMAAELHMIELVAITARRPPNKERLLEILAEAHSIGEIHRARKRRTGRAA